MKMKTKRKNRFLIYALVDPRDNEVRYIGKSSTGLTRPKDHSRPYYHSDDSHRARWIRQLIGLGLSYRIVVLEYCTTHEELGARETKWIREGRLVWRLTNISDGSGLFGYTHTDATKAKISIAHKGRPKSLETRQAISKTLTGRPLDPNVRLELSKIHKQRIANDPRELERLRTLRLGAKNTPEAREKLRQANLGLVHSPERRAINSRAQTGRKRSEESKRKQAETLKAKWASEWGSDPNRKFKRKSE